MTRLRTARTRLAVIALVVAVGAVLLGTTVLAAPGILGPDSTSAVANGSSSIGAQSETAASAESPTTSGGSGTVAAQAVDADRVAIRIDINESGTANWQLEYRVRLDTDDREAAFENVSADIAANESAYADRFETRMAATAAAAENTTGRSMTVGSVTVETDRRELPESYGVVRYSFDWNGFAVVSEDRIAAGDAIAGLFLDSGHRLTIAWPDGYDADTLHPTPDETADTSATWIGPVEFGTDEPQVVLTPSPPSGLGGTGIGGTTIAGILSLLLIIFVAIAIARRRGLPGGLADGASPATAPESERSAEGSTQSANGSTQTDGAESSVTDTASHDSGSSVDDSSATVDTGSEADSIAASKPTDAPPAELLSNEERVLKQLREHGGRMKQQDLVSALQWSDARTSQVVSGLRDEDMLESFRIGRENVLRLPEADAIGAGEADGSNTGNSNPDGSESDESDADDSDANES